MERAPTLNVRPLAIADLKPHPRNYQRHPEAQRDELVKSIRRHGAYKNAVVSADGYILAGHGILAAARADGWKEWPCEVRPYNHDHPDALNLIVTDNEVGNPANELGPDPDRELLAALLKDVEASTGLAGTGYDEKALAALLAEMAGPEPPKDFPEYDENIDVSGIRTATCPECGHEFPV
ncbi:MAG: ParB N-terminal domain-containing protein [Gemmatimonadetes bacterium]|nr:ParB N-terminal domain-containing protein [Gemmatimonadota bacterium]